MLKLAGLAFDEVLSAHLLVFGEIKVNGLNV